jgi:hypothetical protein
VAAGLLLVGTVAGRVSDTPALEAGVDLGINEARRLTGFRIRWCYAIL